MDFSNMKPGSCDCRAYMWEMYVVKGFCILVLIKIKVASLLTDTYRLQMKSMVENLSTDHSRHAKKLRLVEYFFS